MHRSISNTDLDKIAQQFTNYSVDFAQQRNSRTLSMRRNNKITISIFRQSESKANLLLVLPKIELSQFFEIFNSGNTEQIIQLSDSFVNFASTSPAQLSEIIHSCDAAETYGSVLAMSESRELTFSLMKSSHFMFPMFTLDAKEAYIDSGVTIRFYNILQEGDLESLLYTCKLITTLCKNSSYARNSILCYNIHQCLIDMLFVKEKLENEELLFNICLAINAIFKNDEDIESEQVINLIPQLIQSLTILPNTKCVGLILSALAGISNKCQSIVLYYFQCNLDQIAIQMINNPDLTDKVLDVLGNMCVADISYIQKMIDANLFQILVNLISSEYASTALWVMSNIYDAAKPRLEHFITSDFIAFLVDVGNSSSHDVKKEAVFFLATVIVNTNIQVIINFFNHDIVELLIELLGCGERKIISQCLNALNVIIISLTSLQGQEAVKNLFASTDLIYQVEMIAEEQTGIVSEFASSLLRKFSE